MKKLNLVYPDKSDIKYKVSKFPDGQQNLTLTSFNRDYNVYKGCGNYESIFNPVTIVSRLNNWLDLELIVASVASLRELGVKEIHLYVPYIVGGRSDRKFEEGGNNYLKDVLSPIINSLVFESVTCIDPHSYVLEACIKNFKSINNERLVRWSLASIQTDKGNGQSTNLFEGCVLVSPDAGAAHKIHKLAEAIGYKGDIITCSKERDADGTLSKTVVPLENIKQVNRDFIIVDDICDGGRTFINIAKEIKNHYLPYTNEPTIYLIVTHGIFSAGFDELSKYFNGIYCTNSYGDIKDKSFWAGFPTGENFIKQLNIFQ